MPRGEGGGGGVREGGGDALWRDPLEEGMTQCAEPSKGNCVTGTGSRVVRMA